MITIKIKNEEVVKMLQRMKARIENPQPAFAAIGQIVRSSIVRNFIVGGRPVKWKPSQRVLKEGGQTLRDKSVLMNSIHPKAFRNRVEIGTSDIRAAIHNWGGKTGRGHKVTMPQREFMMIQDEDWPEIKATLADYIVKGK